MQEIAKVEGLLQLNMLQQDTFKLNQLYETWNIYIIA